MGIWGMGQLAASTVIFIGAATAAKWWTFAPSYWRLAVVLLLYTAGNLIMLRLIRDFGMGMALSLSAVIQLVAVNLVAFFWFGERVGTIEGAGIAIAILAVTLITLAPYISPR